MKTGLNNDRQIAVRVAGAGLGGENNTNSVDIYLPVETPTLVLLRPLV